MESWYLQVHYESKRRRTGTGMSKGCLMRNWRTLMSWNG